MLCKIVHFIMPSTDDDFKAAMKEAFPNYAGDKYLEMAAGYLFQ